MTIRLTPLFAAGALLAVSGGAALAQTATAMRDVYVRSGPGTQYQVLDKLPAGESVNVLDCNGLWCEISMGGDSGFVVRDYLDDGSRRGRVRAYERDMDDFDSEQIVIERDDPGVTAGLVIGGYYESRPFYIREGYYYWGGRWYARKPGQPGWRTGSWRRWEERRRGGPGDIRDGRTNRPPRIDDRSARIDRDGPGDTRDGRTNRPPRIDDRDVPGGRGGRDRLERRPGAVEGRDGYGDRSTGTVDRPRTEWPREPRPGGGEQRVERPGARTGGLEPRPPSDGGGRTPGGASSDRGDRVGLDRASGGGEGRRDR